ncbi:hypothetical protein W04_0378 [Pseudoalteromonas sp. SW0106-04]|nr:hypothetical protein W04_0378 [Pseudoalteromonas sp. SW0106-04]
MTFAKFKDKRKRCPWVLLYFLATQEEISNVLKSFHWYIQISKALLIVMLKRIL